MQIFGSKTVNTVPYGTIKFISGTFLFFGDGGWANSSVVAAPSGKFLLPIHHRNTMQVLPSVLYVLLETNSSECLNYVINCVLSLFIS